MKHWDVARCTRIFDILVRDFFGIHLTKGSGLLIRLRDWFRCWLSDGCYDANALENSLKDTLGEDRRMFDIDRFGVSGSKVAVTATTLSNTSTYIFSNYNGNCPREKSCGMCLAYECELYTDWLKVTSMLDRIRLRRNPSSGKREFDLIPVTPLLTRTVVE